MISFKLHGKRKKFKVCELKNKPAAHENAFLVDMMKVWSDESLENFFQKEGITFEKKKPPSLEPTKNGFSSLKSIFKKKVASKPDLELGISLNRAWKAWKKEGIRKDHGLTTWVKERKNYN